MQPENCSVAVGAVVAGRSVNQAIRTKNHAGIRIAPILILITKAVDGIADPSLAFVCETIHYAPIVGAPVGSGAVDPAGLIEGDTSNSEEATAGTRESVEDCIGLRLGYIGENRKGKREAEEKSDPASGLAHGKLLILSEQVLGHARHYNSHRQNRIIQKRSRVVIILVSDIVGVIRGKAQVTSKRVAAAEFLVKWRVAVEKVRFPEIRLKMGDQKCICGRRKSFIGHPSASIFRRDLWERVFQHPRDSSPVRLRRDLPDRPTAAGQALINVNIPTRLGGSIQIAVLIK